jgi:hypothetical protein
MRPLFGPGGPEAGLGTGGKPGKPGTFMISEVKG